MISCGTTHEDHSGKKAKIDESAHHHGHGGHSHNQGSHGHTGHGKGTKNAEVTKCKHGNFHDKSGNVYDESGKLIHGPGGESPVRILQ